MPSKAPVLTILQKVGAVVRARREQQSVTVRELARRAGLSQRFVAMVESGHGNISLTKLERLALALESTAAELLGDSARAPSVRQVALLGLRGAGKSTLGARAASATGRRFVELDRVIEERAGMPLAEIFAVHGEPYYRKLEREVLEGLLKDEEPVLVATGGGLVAAPETYEMLRRNALTVWLKAAPEDHWERVVGQGDQRPMASRPNAMAELKAILLERGPLYRKADHVIDTSRLTLDKGTAALVKIVSGAVGGAPAAVRRRAARPSSRNGRRPPAA